jgi:hypothetical protein
VYTQESLSVKDIRKEFPVSDRTRLEINNKYGNIEILNHEEAKLFIEVNIQAKAKDRQASEDLLKMLHVDISQDGENIKVITVIPENLGRYFRDALANDGLTINYRISMPRCVPLNLTNKYGNVFINELTSTSTIEVKYGKLTANSILHDASKPLTQVTLAYAIGSIQTAQWMALDLKYSKLSMSEAKALAMISKYSKIGITEASSLVIDSKYDTYEIGQLKNLVATASYGHFSIRQISNKLHCDTRYTDITVNRIVSGFEAIKVLNSYGAYKLAIDPSASYSLKGQLKYCSMHYPEEQSRVSRFDENNELRIEGMVGRAPQTRSVVNIQSSYGNIRLKP